MLAPIQITVAILIVLLLSNCGSVSPRGSEAGIEGWKTTSIWHGRESIELADFDRLVPACNLHRRDFPDWVEHDGVGTPGILWRAPSDDQPFVSPIGTALPVTYIKGDDGIHIYDVLDSDIAMIGGQRSKLAINLTAPLAYMAKHTDLKIPTVRSMIKTDKYIDNIGIYRFEPVDPDRIPVVLVHGIKSNPTIWKNMVNLARDDEVVRENYQFWSFNYPTGVPMLYSGMHLRQEIARMQELYNPGGIHPRMNEMIIIGHSMGGLVSELQIKNSGDAFWPEGHARPDTLGMEPAQAQMLTDSVFFKAVPQIKRAIFIATPHRGSDIAETRVGDLFSRLIRLPAELTDAFLTLAAFSPMFAEQLVLEGHIPNSIDEMSPGSDFLEALRSLPFENHLPVHSIVAVGESGLQGALVESEDGLVEYRSAHLDEAISEKLVQSNHRAPNHPDAISEVVRILRLHIRR